MRQKSRSRSQDRNNVNRLSRIFGIGRSKSRDESAAGDVIVNQSHAGDPISADLCLAEKAERLLEARQSSLVRWKQAHLLAWAQLELGLPAHYCRALEENVKSGRVSGR